MIVVMKPGSGPQQVEHVVGLLETEREEVAESLEALAEMRPVCNEPHVGLRTTSKLVEAAPRTLIFDWEDLLCCELAQTGGCFADGVIPDGGRYGAEEGCDILKVVVERNPRCL